MGGARQAWEKNPGIRRAQPIVIAYRIDFSLAGMMGYVRSEMEFLGIRFSHFTHPT